MRVSTIARRRYFRPDQNFSRGPRVNEQIRKSPIRLIDENNEMIGVVPIEDAQRRARDVGLDLVEVASESEPPVCRILDYGKYKYEQAKKDKANKARSKSAEMKEVRLGRSMKIDPHDIEIRLNQARRFLMEGHKVQIVQNFRGREMVHRQRGVDRMNDIVAKMSDVAKLEAPPRQAGRRMSMILAPDKPKIEQIKRREAGRKQKEEQEKVPEDAAAPVEELGSKPESDEQVEDAAKEAVSKSTRKKTAKSKPEAEAVEASKR